MKKIFVIGFSCLLFCGCINQNNWKKKIEITDTIYTPNGIQLKVKAKKNEKYNNVCIKLKITQEKTNEQETIQDCRQIDYGKTKTFFFNPDIKDIYQGLDYEILEVKIK